MRSITPKQEKKPRIVSFYDLQTVNVEELTIGLNQREGMAIESLSEGEERVFYVFFKPVPPRSKA
jgi:hypothetical protein